MSRQTIETGELAVELASEGSTHDVVMSGRIDERSLLVDVADRLGGRVRIDLEKVSFINSAGVREWIKMMRALDAAGVELELRRCSEPMVHQMNMIVEAKGRSRVESFYAPYGCEECGWEGSMLIAAGDHMDELRKQSAPEMGCPECSASMELSEIPERYLLFLEDD